MSERARGLEVLAVMPNPPRTLPGYIGSEFKHCFLVFFIANAKPSGAESLRHFFGSDVLLDIGSQTLSCRHQNRKKTKWQHLERQKTPGYMAGGWGGNRTHADIFKGCVILYI